MRIPEKCASTLRGHQGPVLVVKYNTEGQYCLSGGQDKMIRLWNAATFGSVATYAGHGREVLDISVAEDNTRIASCGGDKAVFIWDVGSTKVLRKLNGHEQVRRVISQRRFMIYIYFCEESELRCIQ